MQVFPCNYCEIFKNIYFEKYLPTTASIVFGVSRYIGNNGNQTNIL